MTASIRITWRDAHELVGANVWADPVDIEYGDCVITTVGLLVREDDNFITVAQSVSNDGMYQGVFSIPVSSIVETVEFL